MRVRKAFAVAMLPLRLHRSLFRVTHLRNTHGPPHHLPPPCKRQEIIEPAATRRNSVSLRAWAMCAALIERGILQAQMVRAPTGMFAFLFGDFSVFLTGEQIGGWGVTVDRLGKADRQTGVESDLYTL